jgi:two-component system CheB/CheR fusion protein
MRESPRRGRRAAIAVDGDFRGAYSSMGDARSLSPTSNASTGVRVVGLGASAGGLEALEQFLSNVPAASGLAYLVVQHMDPNHKTLLGELLQRATSMPVHEAAEARSIEPNSVYVIPPDSELTIAGGMLHLAKPAEPRGQRLPIDVLFSSLARELGERAIGVVLSGMGSDGTQGLQAIKTQGGLTLAQHPESAQFDSMPRSAIAAGCVDIIALPAQMPARISSVTGAHPPTALSPSGPPDQATTALDTILALLHQHTRHDLALYKSNTLIRRIGRRVAVHGLDSMAAYADFLRANTQELDLLFKETLIGVTSFFRDPPVWQDLQDKVLPVLLERHAEDSGPMRAWVVGCSTGEEAFSLAIAFTEALESMPVPAKRKLQIFATDLNADAITAARSGRFAATIARDLTPQRLARFFSERPDGYEVDKRIRDMVLFAQHDVIIDPPFTRLDIVSCRNLLIYFGTTLQKRLVPLFHYSLRPGGVLLLGGSETVGRAQSLFHPLDQKSRLYWRSDNAGSLGAVVFPTHRRPATRSAPQETPLPHFDTPPANLQSLADQLLLQSYSPAAVLVNDGGDIVYISGRTGRYLEPAAGKANWNIHVMALPSIRAQLAGALRKALQEKTSVELWGLRLDDDTTAAVDITVQAVVQPRGLEGMAMIVFRDVPVTPGRRGRRAKSPGGADPSVAEELLHSREEIRALRQEMRASQEELQAANEELQSTNEELQSANEELTTSKEEAQSMNEELQTINGELQSKLDDLALAQSDMQNLLNSTDIATLFLDNQLNVRRYTEQIARIIHLREGDIGRPLSELASTLVYPELHADVKETLRTLAFSEKQIPTSDGHWFTVRIMPYRTLANVIQGVVITFVDITVAKELESRLRKA